MKHILTPRLPRLRYDRILWIVGIFCLFIFLISAISRKKSSSVEKIMISVQPLKSGSSLLTERNVRKLLQKGITERIEGALLNEVDFNHIEAFLETDPFVKDANVYLDINNRLRVDVVQREPILRIMDNQGGNYYLDASGAKIPFSSNYTARVMVATGNLPAYSTDFMEKKRSALKDLMLLIEKIEDDSALANFFQQIHVTNKEEFILTPLIGDQTIMLGSVANTEEKFEKLKIFYKEAMPRTGWREYERLDLRYKDQVVAVR